MNVGNSVQIIKVLFACVGSVYGFLEANVDLVEAREWTHLPKEIINVIIQAFHILFASCWYFSVIWTAGPVVFTSPSSRAPDPNCVPSSFLLAVTVFAEGIARPENVARSSLAFIVSRRLSFNALGFMCFTLFR